MWLLLTAAGFAAAAYWWYINRDKPVKRIISELRYALDMQAIGAGGLLDDKLQGWRNRFEAPDASNKVAVVTGGARGIGLEVVRQLLKTNMKVIAGVRRPDVMKRLAQDMENGDNLIALPLDLQSLESIKEFAKQVISHHKDINLLVCNAGIMFGDYKLTKDGFETQIGVNYLGHFYLTHWLLPALKRGARGGDVSRVVNVASCAHFLAHIQFDDINGREHYDTTFAYAQSKLAQIMSARHINRLMEEEKSPVRCFSVHPGIVNTDIFQDTAFRKYFRFLMDIFFKTPAQGALQVVYTSLHKDLAKNGGTYISNCREGYTNSYSKKEEQQKRLHSLTCEMTGIDERQFGKVDL